MSAIKKGAKAGNQKYGASIEGDIYIDLVISSTIETESVLNLIRLVIIVTQK